MKRVFVALPIAKEPDFDLAAFQARPSLRIIPPKDLHVTLVPPWEMAYEALTIAKLKLVSGRVRPFELQFQSVTFGPDKKQPRLIWAEGEAPEEIYELRYKLYQALGQKPDRRAFKLHLTLARFKPEDFKKFPQRVLHQPLDFHQPVKSFALYESRLLPSGADYEILENFPLKI